MEQLGPVTDSAPEPATGPLPPAAAPPPRPDRVIGGVAGLIATRLGLDALWVRLGFVVLGLAGGIGVLVYAGLWLALIAGAWSRWARVVGGVVLIGLVPVVLSESASGFATGPIAIVLLLAGLALALWQPNRSATVTQPGSAFPPPTQPWTVERALPDSDGTTLAPGAAVPPRAQRPRREPSVLGRMTLGVAAVVGAVWAIADQADGGRNHPEQWLGAAAVVCAAGLIVGAFAGRARWLVVPAVVLGGAGYVTGTTARMGIPLADATGDRYISIGSYTSSSSITQRVGAGEIRISIDEAPTQPVHVDARVGFGTIRIWAADDVTVAVLPRADHGDVRSDGLSVGAGSGIITGDGDTADVVIDAWVGRGDISIGTYSALPSDETIPLLPTIDPVPEQLLPAAVGSLVAIRDGVSMTTDGWIVLGNGDAVISPQDEVTASELSSVYPGQGGSTTIDTQWGQFRLLPRSLLLTPDQQILDLQALREQVAAHAGTVTTTAAPPAVGQPPTSIPPVTAPTGDPSPTVTTIAGG